MSKSKKNVSLRELTEKASDVPSRKESIAMISKVLDRYVLDPELTANWRSSCIQVLFELVDDIKKLKALEMIGTQEYEQNRGEEGFSWLLLFGPDRSFKGSWETMKDYQDLFDIMIAKCQTIFNNSGEVKETTFKRSQ